MIYEKVDFNFSCSLHVLALFHLVDGQDDADEDNWGTGHDEESLMSENFIGIGTGHETIEDSSAFGSQESLVEADDGVNDGYEVNEPRQWENLT